MIVYDVTREKTFQAVTKWKADIDENLSSIPVILLANKVPFKLAFVNSDILSSVTCWKKKKMLARKISINS